jgi:hypothetical protein
MTKTLEQIQEENRKAIIMANNPDAKSYEEALEMELGFGCIIEDDYWHDLHFVLDNYSLNSGFKNMILKVHLYTHNQQKIYKDYVLEKYRIIGKPLTLDRVLIALEGLHFGLDTCELSPKHIWFYVGSYEDWIEWDLTKTTLEEQEENVQRKINELLTKTK